MALSLCFDSAYTLSMLCFDSAQLVKLIHVDSAALFLVLFRPVNLGHGQYWVLIKFQFQVFRFNFSIFLSLSI